MEDLGQYGWNEHWARLLEQHAPGLEPGRVVRHDGAGMVVVGANGTRMVMFTQRLDPAPTVGDWIALGPTGPVSVLPRTSLLRRRNAMRDTEQVLAANVDVVLLVCGLDRPIKAGKLQRGAALAADAGAAAVVVLTKADRVGSQDVTEALAEIANAMPDTEVVVTSVKEGSGVPELLAIVQGRTLTMLGESGAGKSSIVNAVLGVGTVAEGAVRDGDSKGRHTTTSRQLHALPGGGVLIDTPGIRSIGLWVETESVDATFVDIEDMSARCRFSDCAHDREPGCAVQRAIANGRITAERVEAWRVLSAEAAAAGTAGRVGRQDRAGNRPGAGTGARPASPGKASKTGNGPGNGRSKPRRKG
ncbi:MAG: ribosome small subunit-dependent GTPase A [Acidimicrobiia bacterium]